MATMAIVIASLAPIPDNPPLEDVPFIDKWVHFVMYGGVVFAAWLDRIQSKTKGNSLRFALVVCVYSSLLGGLMELLQGLTSYRSCDLWDFYANVFGAVLASAIAICVVLCQRRHRPF